MVQSRTREWTPRERAANRISLLLLGLLLFLGVLAPRPGRAEVFADPGLLAFLPPGEVVADGATAVDLYLLALKPDGGPWSGLKLRVNASAGELGSISEPQPGIYHLAYTPPKLDAAQDVTLTIRAKGVPQVKASFHLVPSTAHRFELSASPDHLVLGQDGSATISFTLVGAPDDAQLDFRLSAGELQNLTSLGQGRYTALYVPPKVNYPQVALLTVVDRADPGHSYGALAIPLVGKANFPVSKVPPNSKVMMEVGGRSFGPMQADANGRVRIPIVVPPGIDTARISVVGAEAQQRDEDLKVPETRRLALFPLEQGIPADSSLSVPVRVVVVRPDGSPDTGARLQLTASTGTLSAPVHEGDGIYRADFRPADSAEPGEVTFTASLDGSSAVQQDSVTVPLVPVRPSAVTLSADPPKLAQGATGFKLLVQAKGPEGIGLGGRKVHVEASGAKVKGPTKDLKGGDYSLVLETTGSGPVEVTATVATPTTGNPLRSLVVVPLAQRVLADGLSSVLLTVVAVDEFGYPVAGVPLDISLLSGDGSVPAKATTDEAGLAQVYYTAGRKPGVVSVQFSSGVHRAVVNLLQLPSGVAPQLSGLPQSGTASAVRLRSDWSAVVRSLRVEREGAELGQAVEGGAAAPSGEPAKLEIEARPSSVAPGGRVELLIHVEDAEGRGLGGHQLDLLTSAGTVSGVTEKGGGLYRAELQAPADAGGTIKVSVAVDDGALLGFVKIPVAAVTAAASAQQPEEVEEEPASAWGPIEGQAGEQPVEQAGEQPAEQAGEQPAEQAGEQAGEQPAEQAGEQPAEQVAGQVAQAPAPAGEHPWLRFRFSTGSAGYHYQYTVFSQPLTLATEGNPLPYEHSLVLSGDEDALDGGEPSSLSVPAVDVRAEAWLPAFPYVGAELRYRGTWWAVETDSWTQYHEGPDLSWTDHFFTALLQLRYYVDSGEDRYSIALGGGSVTTAVPLVTYWTVEGSRGIWFFPWGFTSLYGQLQAQAELGFGLDARVVGALGTEAYTGIFAHSLDIELAYRVAEHLSVYGGYARLARHVVVPQDTTAEEIESMVEAEDSRAGLSIGLGADF